MNNKGNYAKLLDYWSPPLDAGEPVGCIATTFTFSPVFFEEECLSRFTKMETHPDTDGPLYLIEREEKLVGLCCATVLVDQHHCRGNRSLRWDMIPAKLKTGVLHSKVALLYWSNLIRLIIVSANLTKEGYRRNQEIFSVLDYKEKGHVPIDPLNNVIDYLKDVIQVSLFNEDHPALQRWMELLDKISAVRVDWGKLNSEIPRKAVKIFPVFLKPGGKDGLTRLKDYWNMFSYTPPDYAEVTSPFFDPPEGKNLPASNIWKILRQKGPAKVVYKTTAEDIPNEENSILIHGPKTLSKNAPIHRPGVKVDFRLLSEKVKSDAVETIRSIHLKTILLKNNEWVLFMIGSSNFTTPGLGIGKSGNYEANLVYIVSKSHNKKEYKNLFNSNLKGEKTKKNIRFLEEIKPGEDDINSLEFEILPECFDSLIFNKEKQKSAYIEIHFHSKDLPAGFEIKVDNNGNILYNETRWQNDKRPLFKKVIWDSKSIPTGFRVRWTGSRGYAYWPVIVLSQKALPPPEELKDLPLEVLIHIISSARPLHQILKKYLSPKGDKIEISDFTPTIDFHKKVDTRSFLLRRTRRISNALCSLRQHLERPVFTEETLHWRLYGPVGVETFIHAIKKEAQSEEEKAFLLAELALELSKVKPVVTNNSLKAATIKSELKHVIRQIQKDTKLMQKKIRSDMRDYVKKTFKAALKWI